MKWRRLGLILIIWLVLSWLAACGPTASTRPPVNVEGTPQVVEPTGAPPASTEPPLVIEGRTVEMEWPERLRMGDSDVIRLALVPTRGGYVARAEFPDHSLQTREVPVPRPNGYLLYAAARLEGVGFDIAPTGEQEMFVPEGEEVAWRWTLSPRKPGQQRLSVQLWLRWAPGPGITGPTRSSQAYSKGLDVQVSSFLGLSPGQAAAVGVIGLLIGGGLLLFGLANPYRRAYRSVEPLAPAPTGAALQLIQPNPALAIETPPQMSLSVEENGLLSGLFQSYARLVVENEFLSGYSGARTFLARPIRPDGCADALTIVKLGSREAIRQEYENYELFVKDRLPPMTARIQRAPVALINGRKVGPGERAGAAKAAVQYTFIAEPGRPPLSLRQALLTDPDPGLILRLFEIFGPSWWMQRRPHTFRLGMEYDRLLPPHYLIEPVQSAPGDLTLSETSDPAGLNLQINEIVRVVPFPKAELRADGCSYSLIGQLADGRPALRLRWLNPVPPAGLVTARIVSSRADLLRGWTAGMTLPEGASDPLEILPAVLAETIAGTRSVIHGDLNLENILVGPGSLVWLIDFAQTREGHPLFDFAHLESELIAHVLAPRAGSAEAYFDLWRSGADPLLIALHQAAGRCLFDPADPREYHLALYLSCLGALKYPNLNPLAKHCLFLTAAATVDLIRR